MRKHGEDKQASWSIEMHAQVFCVPMPTIGNNSPRCAIAFGERNQRRTPLLAQAPGVCTQKSIGGSMERGCRHTRRGQAALLLRDMYCRPGYVPGRWVTPLDAMHLAHPPPHPFLHTQAPAFVECARHAEIAPLCKKRFG